MSSALSKQKKRLRRKRNMTDEQANGIVEALNRDAVAKQMAVMSLKDEISKEATAKMMSDYIPKIQGEMLVCILGCLRCEYKWGHDRLSRFLHRFNEFADTMKRDGTTSDDIKDLLFQECGMNILEEFEKCGFESEKVEKSIRKDFVA